jgi:hypothetical protein
VNEEALALLGGGASHQKQTKRRILDATLVVILRNMLFLILNPFIHSSHLKSFTFNCCIPIIADQDTTPYYVPSYSHKCAGALEFGVIKVFVHIPQSRSATSNSLISALMYCRCTISDQNSDIHEAGNSTCSGTVLLR